MSALPETTEQRLLIVGDLPRLGPIAADFFAPHRIDGVHTYLDGVAEIPRSPTRAILVGFDPACRKPEAAIRALKSVAGEAPVVLCCEPAYESSARRLLDSGADGYVIFPPEAADLENALGIPSQKTQRRWIETPQLTPVPTGEELELLADLLPRLSMGMAEVLHSFSSLVATALNAEHVTVVFDDKIGRSGRGAANVVQVVLVEAIHRGAERMGQIRVGPSRSGGFSHEDTTKLRHYSVLISRLMESADRTRYWRDLALTDDLTGLPNRRHLQKFLEDTIAKAEQQKITVTALVFDIDDFKRYNDTYGHDAGDEILVDVGRLFQKCSRKTDLVARYGGDEFVVIFWDPEGPRTLGSRHPGGFLEVVNRFQKALRTHPFARLGAEALGCLTISGGLAHYPWQAKSAAELIEAADQALLQAKIAGKSRFWLVGQGPVGE